MYFQKVVGADDSPDPLTVFTHGGDETTQGDKAGIEKQVDHFGDPAEILAALFGAEAQTGAQAMADIVAIQDKGAAAQDMELLFHGMGKRGFPGPGKPRKPEGAGTMAIQELTPLAGDSGVMPDYIIHCSFLNPLSGKPLPAVMP
jgi:hypothetical protein